MTDNVKLDGTNLLANETISLDDILDAFKAGNPVVRHISLEGTARYDLEVSAQLVPRAETAPAPATEAAVAS